jgi:tetratricopeptide (TPR) repeat protein
MIPKINREYAAIVISALFFLLIYFGFDNKPESHKVIEQSRSVTFEVTGIENILREAKQALPGDTVMIIRELEVAVAGSDGGERLEYLKGLSSIWYQIGNYAIAGFYAGQVAEEEDSGLAWSIAGTTYARGITDASSQKVADFCFSKAIASFENAISLEPSNVAHQMNLALCYVEKPPADNPMRGIQMLLDLNAKHPENVPVLTNLARLAIETGQYDRALERLLKAWELDPENRSVACALAQVYEGLGDDEKSNNYYQICAINN